MRSFCSYLLIVNALGLILMHTDKKRARMHRIRLPEALLWGTAFIGGSIGVCLGMFLFHHKTKHPLFLIFLPILSLLQLLLFMLVRYA